MNDYIIKLFKIQLNELRNWEHKEFVPIKIHNSSSNIRPVKLVDLSDSHGGAQNSSSNLKYQQFDLTEQEVKEMEIG